ncbi:DUF2254 domain-containing protein [Frigoribacterium faeni]|uniref:DUF2254 domain-containing protein n=1 Tax=Frigoribacterium faeni TaxID=145483 RepID=UPI001FAB55EC|nr:DUF2254 domain-containing protein [Frigoribacterium faeni]MCJ0701481.1 DUF2254 domain-containing protein [Frigoribacterium faeni]
MRTVTLRLRESFWFFPAVLGVFAIVVAQLLVVVDQEIVDRGASIPILDALSASGGRAILTTVGTAMLTVAGTSFSITISVLATTSSTYGPRLVRNFMADRANQFVLAAFTSTFLYSIVVLRSVHTAIDDGTAFVPVIAIHVAVALGVVDVAVLVFFIHHIASSVQITSLQKQVQEDLETAVSHAYRFDGDSDRDGDGDGVSVQPQPDGGVAWSIVESQSDGYVQSVGWERLVSWAHDHDQVVDMTAMPGDHLIEGDCLLRMAPRDGAHGRPVPETDVDRLRRMVTLGAARTPFQDVGFALQQLVEIGVRGLASGTNDPYTAVSALDLSATALVPLWAGRQAITAYLDEDAVARVLPHWPAPEQLVDTVFDGVLTYGVEHPIVLDAARRLLARLGDVASGPRAVHLGGIRTRLDRV